MENVLSSNDMYELDEEEMLDVDGATGVFDAGYYIGYKDKCIYPSPF